jgi:hypothetical protein
VTNHNEAPRITFNGGGESTGVEIVEGDTAVATVTATDPDAGAGLTYSIKGGADCAEIQHRCRDGCAELHHGAQLRGADRCRRQQCLRRHRAGFRRRLADRHAIDSRSRLPTANEAPSITSNGGGATANVNVLENASVVTTVTAVDPDAGAPKNFSISGGAGRALNSASTP